MQSWRCGSTSEGLKNIDQQIDDGRLGTTGIGYSKSLDDLGWSEVMVLLAGYCAEVHGGYDEREAREGANDDFHCVESFDLAAGHAEAEAIAAAMALVSEPGNWRAINALAAELLEDGRLNDAAIRGIVAASDVAVTS